MPWIRTNENRQPSTVRDYVWLLILPRGWICRLQMIPFYATKQWQLNDTDRKRSVFAGLLGFSKSCFTAFGHDSLVIVLILLWILLSFSVFPLYSSVVINHGRSKCQAERCNEFAFNNGSNVNMAMVCFSGIVTVPKDDALFKSLKWAKTTSQLFKSSFWKTILAHHNNNCQCVDFLCLVPKILLIEQGCFRSKMACHI